MLNGENTALLNILLDYLANADARFDVMRKLLEKATNPDHITKKGITAPLACNSALSLKMAANGQEIAEVAQLHTINRVLCTTEPNVDIRCSTKWKMLTDSSVPSKRDGIFKVCAKQWTSSSAITELFCALKA